MPHMDGYEMTRAIRSQEPHGTHTPIIALTANTLKGEDQRCRAVGMDDYRSKPTPLLELKAVLDKWLPAGVEADAPVASTPAAVVTRHSAPAAPVDVGVLRDLVGDDPEVVNEFLMDFRESAATMAAELHAACAASQPAAAAAIAHKLKSSARAVGAFALGKLCEAIEEDGKTGRMNAIAAMLP
jgi:HPt (histidine-containing phosphotransfer) domain-containing protein